MNIYKERKHPSHRHAYRGNFNTSEIIIEKSCYLWYTTIMIENNSYIYGKKILEIRIINSGYGDCNTCGKKEKDW